MGHIQTVHAISDLLDNRCNGCSKRDELNKKYGSLYSRIDGYCNQICPIGKELQALGHRLGRGTESETDHLRGWSKSEASRGTSELNPLLAPECNFVEEIPFMA